MVHDVCIHTRNIHTYMHHVEAMTHNSKIDTVMKCTRQDIGCCQLFSVMNSFRCCPSPSPREVVITLNFFFWNYPFIFSFTTYEWTLIYCLVLLVSKLCKNGF